MVAKTLVAPNLRKFFVPDIGFYISDFDLAGADAQVVAWESGDEELKDAFRKGLKIHIKNARDIFPDKTKGYSDEALKKLDYPGGIYHDCKRGVHATNYGAVAPTLAARLGWTTIESERFQKNWFGLHPKIKEWHERTDRCLLGAQCWNCFAMAEGEAICKHCGEALGRTVKNAFGYRRIYFDRMDDLLPKALAWVPQSTVAICTDRAAVQIDEQVKWCQLLLQVHDSLVGQFPFDRRQDLPELKKAMDIEVPYEDPLHIPWGCAISTKSWGDCEPYAW